MILIGDAAHPYGPGGQGISMALKDAKALAELVAAGFTEVGKADFQHKRAEESKRLGEAAEARNKAKNQSQTNFGVWSEGVMMKIMAFLTGGVLKM